MSNARQGRSLKLVVLLALLVGLVLIQLLPSTQSDQADRSGSQSEEPSHHANPDPAPQSAASTSAAITPPPLQDYSPDALQHQAAAGDAVAQRKLSELYELCFPYSVNPHLWLEGIDQLFAISPDSAPHAEFARHSVRTLCAPLDEGQPIPADTSMLWLQEAANRGDLIARARIAVRQYENFEPEQLDALISDVLSSQDPDALFELSSLMARPLQDRGIQPIPASLSGYPSASEAWAIAACRRGARACRPDSMPMFSLCVTLARCSYASYEHFASQELLTPSDLQRIERRVLPEINTLITP